MILYTEFGEQDRFALKHFLKQHRLKQTADRLYIAKKLEKIIGIAKVQEHEKQAWLHGVYIAPAQRQQGFGSGLILTICHQVNMPCYGFIQPERQTFYQQLGFQPATPAQLNPALRLRFEQYQKSKPHLAVWCFNHASRHALKH